MSLEFTPADVRYIESHFAPLDVLCRSYGRDPERVAAQIAARIAPRPSYALPDGRRMLPYTFFDLPDAAQGAAGLQRLFTERYKAAAREYCLPLPGERVQEAFEAYLGGVYGVCLRVPSPEGVARKEWLMGSIEAQLERAQPASSDWCEQLRLYVDTLDRLEMPFCDYDRRFFGRPLSRDRLITDVRRAYPGAFADFDLVAAR